MRFHALASIFAMLVTISPAVAHSAEAVSDAPDGGAASDIGSPFGAEPIGDSALRTVAGREDTVQVSHADQVAGVSRNSVGDNSRTGEARIDGNAFQNMSGLSILNVNTGNNVAINAAMNVNISLNTAP
jgi:hypothetical protein